MINLKYRSLAICFIVISCLVACKKIPEYTISDSMKKYFLYQPGSYWIYRDDFTGSIDSTYVTSYRDFFTDGKTGSKTTERYEWLYVNFQSVFLYDYMIIYTSCDEPDYMSVGSHQDTINHTGETESAGGPVSYNPNWPQNQKIIPPCATGSVFIYRTSPTDTLNNVVYHNIIYSENVSRDSSSSNPYYFHRKITFSEDAGIIRYFEVIRKKSIIRSYTLLRSKIVR
jgi:hypothetical protein